MPNKNKLTGKIWSVYSAHRQTIWTEILIIAQPEVPNKNKLIGKIWSVYTTHRQTIWTVILIIAQPKNNKMYL